MAFIPTPQQKAIIEHDNGPALVIAGPGAGKSFTLVQRITHLIVNRGIPAENIFVATFTQKAANELQDRISRELLSRNIVVNFDDMYIGTFHSICLRLLEDYRDFTRLKKNFTVMDQFDQTYFFFQNLAEFEKEGKVEVFLGKNQVSRWTKASTVCEWINKLTEELVDSDKLSKDKNTKLVILGRWHLLYQRLLKQENLLDFSMIQADALKLLENNKEIQKALREKLRYFLIDEYQDTNTVQERIVFSLLNREKNICVVGDDDQGLYRFRGATIRNILEFPKRVKPVKCAVFNLDVNFRSDPGIIDFYNQWMDGSLDDFSWAGEKKIKYRFEKKIVPEKGKKGIRNPVIKISGHIGKNDWHEQVLAFLNHFRKKYIKNWNQVAFLFRSVKNDKVKALAQYLEENGIPIYAPRSDLFFEREEIRMLIGAFLFIFPIFKEIRADWQKKFSKLAIWDYYDKCLKDFANELRKKENRELQAWAVHRTREIGNMPIANRPLDYGFSILFYQLLQFPLFSHWLTVGDTSLDERPARNMAIFSQLLVKFEYLHHIQVLHPKYLQNNVTNLFNHYFRYLVDGGISEFEDANEATPSGAVAFMTIHQSKGLEFPVTVVGSMNAVPRKDYTELDKILEEKYYSREPFEPLERVKEFDFKRVFYTAFSRAKNILALTCQEVEPSRYTRSVPSRYFRDFYDPLPAWNKAKLTGLKVDKVASNSAKSRYSYTSHILVYEGCPRQYQFFKYWEFTPVREGPMLFGQLVHQTIEDIHKHVLMGDKKSINEENARLWFDVNYANLSHKDRVYLAPKTRERAFKQILRYMERKKGKWDDIRQTEVDVSLVKDDYILTGKIDLIQGEGDTVEIVDFKSMAKPDQYKEMEQINRYRRQLEIYAHLVENRYGLTVSGMNLYYTGEENGSPIFRFPYNSRKVGKTIAEVEKVIGKMEDKEFSVDKRPDKLCGDCDLNSFCNRM